MGLRDVYYYFVAPGMKAGVLIADLFNLDIDQKSNGRVRVRFGSSDCLSSQRNNNVLVIFG